MLLISLWQRAKAQRILDQLTGKNKDEKVQVRNGSHLKLVYLCPCLDRLFETI